LSQVKTYGFGFNPKETNHHFLLEIPTGNAKITVYERFNWDQDEQVSDLNDKDKKVILSKTKWNKVKNVIKKEFNRRLKDEGLPARDFDSYYVPLERLYGKELMLLLWSIENAEVGVIDLAIKNWLGLSPEERWWLFTMTNASTGHYSDNRGWRIALRYALTENPVDNKLAGSFVQRLF
jgi:hypothetical protein